MRRTSLASYPVFPEWIFTGEVHLEPGAVDRIVSELESIEVNSTDYGFITKKNSLGPQAQVLRQLIGGIFYENAVAHFRLPETGLRNIESVDAQIMGIVPGQQYAPSVSRHRWYQCAVWLSATDQSSALKLDMNGAKLHTTAIGIQEHNHIVEPGVAKMVFWPAHLPWGFTTNHDNARTLLLMNSFMIKGHTQL